MTTRTCDGANPDLIVRRHRDWPGSDDRCWKEVCDRDDHIEEPCTCTFSFRDGRHELLYPHVGRYGLDPHSTGSQT